jgi:hypothetical protein
MTAKIIQFTQAKRSREIQQMTRTNQLRQIINTVSRYNSKDLQASEYETKFKKEHDALLTNLRTKKSKYKLPTIMSGYRKEINPVDALYQNLQEALFKFDKNDKFYVWIIALFDNREWLDSLILDLQKDCNDITKFQLENYKNDYGIGLNELHILQNIKSNFAHYRKTFAMMRNY